MIRIVPVMLVFLCVLFGYIGLFQMESLAESDSQLNNPLSAGKPESPERAAALRERAGNLVVAGNLMVTKAAEYSASGASRSDMSKAITLYIEGGRIFDQARILFQSLYPEYSERVDVENSVKAMQFCLARVTELREEIQKRSA